MELTQEQVQYLSGQAIGRLATVDPTGAPQNNPVGFRYNAALGTIDIGGNDLAASRKFKNLATNDRVAFVIDDIVSFKPWRVRCVEIRGRAEALVGQDRDGSGSPSEVIRVHPERVISFGLGEASGSG
jgi:pyridoxamine 5'-phosphate oxidase family protein